jgi:periplasmic copper chaperone A
MEMKNADHLISARLLASVFSAQAHSQTLDQNTIVVEHPWARATPAGAKTGAVYMTLINHDSTSDRLLSATTPVADKVQLHSASEDNGISRMREIRTFEVAPGAGVSFNPGGMHIMVVGLKQPLKEGQSFPLTLTFEKAGKEDVSVPVARVGAMQHGDIGPTHEHGDAAKK